MASDSDDARLELDLDDSALNISDMDEENGTGSVRSKRGKYAARMDKSVIQEFLLEWEKEGDGVWDLYPNVNRRTASTWRECKDVIAAPVGRPMLLSLETDEQLLIKWIGWRNDAGFVIWSSWLIHMVGPSS